MSSATACSTLPKWTRRTAGSAVPRGVRVHSFSHSQRMSSRLSWMKCGRLMAAARTEGEEEEKARENTRQLSIFTLPSLTTLAHLTISVEMNWRNFSRVPPPSSAP